MYKDKEMCFNVVGKLYILVWMNLALVLCNFINSIAKIHKNTSFNTLTYWFIITNNTFYM